MIKLTDSHGNLFPAIRNLLNLIWLSVGIVLGWGGNIVWNRQAESDQLVDDAREMVEIREVRHNEKEVLDDNVKDALKSTSDCGNATDVEFTRKLRQNRMEGRESDGEL